jgi:anaphase-promoting complex subunit 3
LIRFSQLKFKRDYRSNLMVVVKQHSTRDRRRQPTHSRNRSTESDKDEVSPFPPGEVAYSPSPPSAALSPRSEVSPSPSNWTSAQEQLAQEEYEAELAEHYLYELLRRFARASRALSHYDCQKCLEELEQLPHAQQKSSAVIAMVGKAHYEQQDFASVRYNVIMKS